MELSFSCVRAAVVPSSKIQPEKQKDSDRPQRGIEEDKSFNTSTKMPPPIGKSISFKDSFQPAYYQVCECHLYNSLNQKNQYLTCILHPTAGSQTGPDKATCEDICNTQLGLLGSGSSYGYDSSVASTWCPDETCNKNYQCDYCQSGGLTGGGTTNSCTSGSLQ